MEAFSSATINAVCNTWGSLIRLVHLDMDKKRINYLAAAMEEDLRIEADYRTKYGATLGDRNSS